MGETVNFFFKSFSAHLEKFEKEENFLVSDVLYTRLRTTGIIETVFAIGDSKWKFVVGLTEWGLSLFVDIGFSGCWE